MNFIKYYVNFESKKMMSTFMKEVEQLSGRTIPMGTEEYLLDKFKKEGIEQGIERGKHETAIQLAHDMLADGEALEKIAKYTKLSIQEIEEL